MSRAIESIAHAKSLLSHIKNSGVSALVLTSLGVKSIVLQHMLSPVLRQMAIKERLLTIDQGGTLLEVNALLGVLRPNQKASWEYASSTQLMGKPKDVCIQAMGQTMARKTGSPIIITGHTQRWTPPSKTEFAWIQPLIGWSYFNLWEYIVENELQVPTSYFEITRKGKHYRFTRVEDLSVLKPVEGNGTLLTTKDIRDSYVSNIHNNDMSRTTPNS